MTQSEEIASLAPDIADEHHQLRVLLGGMEAMPTVSALHSRLNALLELLEEHFAHEEAPDGLYDVIETRAPRLVARLEKLFKDHESLLASTKQLIEEAAGQSDDALQQLRERTAELAARLSEHDQRETALLQESLVTDIGETD